MTNPAFKLARRNRRRCGGLSLPEVLVSTLVSGSMMAGMTAMVVSSMRTADKTRAVAIADQNASQTMQMIVTDVRETKYVTILDNGQRLRLVHAAADSRGFYNRFEPDLDNQVDYYLSDDTGVLGKAGTRLWTAKADGTGKIKLRKDVCSLLFEQDTSRSVQITVIAQGTAANGPQKTTLSQRVVYMRNY